MSKRRCGVCGKDPAAGFASIGEMFYCHGDYDPEPTCYMRAQSKEYRDAFNKVVVECGFPEAQIIVPEPTP